MPTFYTKLWWNFIIGGIIIVAFGMGIIVQILARGIADPPRPSTLFWQDQSFDWMQEDPTVTDEATIIFFISPNQIPAKRFTIETTATLTSHNHPLHSWGIWLMDDHQSRLLVGINSAQYVTARRCPMNAVIYSLQQCEPLLEPSQQIRTFWKSFHHIHPHGEANQLRLDYLPPHWSGGLTLWLNQEWMWDLSFVPMVPNVEWGLWIQSYSGEIPIDIHWHKITVWLE